MFNEPRSGWLSYPLQAHVELYKIVYGRIPNERNVHARTRVYHMEVSQSETTVTKNTMKTEDVS